MTDTLIMYYPADSELFYQLWVVGYITGYCFVMITPVKLRNKIFDSLFLISQHENYLLNYTQHISMRQNKGWEGGIN